MHVLLALALALRRDHARRRGSRTPVVRAHMLREVVRAREALLAAVALEGPLERVRAQVAAEVLHPLEHAPAREQRAHERLCARRHGAGAGAEDVHVRAGRPARVRVRVRAGGHVRLLLLVLLVLLLGVVEDGVRMALLEVRAAAHLRGELLGRLWLLHLRLGLLERHRNGELARSHVRHVHARAACDAGPSEPAHAKPAQVRELPLRG